MLAQVIIQQSTRPLEDAAREAPDLASAFLVLVALAVALNLRRALVLSG